MKTSTERITVGKHIRKGFSAGRQVTTRVLKDISLQVTFWGEFVSIMGPSGSGKNTLLYVLGGLDAPRPAPVLLDRMDISHFTDEKMEPAAAIGNRFCFSSFYNLIPNLNVGETLCSLSAAGWQRQPVIRNRLAQLLETVGHYPTGANTTPTELSGGQQQRVAIARALMGSHKVPSLPDTKTYREPGQQNRRGNR